MSKAILIPIKPIWCAKIMNGYKTIEVRKNKALYKATMKLIEEQGYATFFMYCTKEKQILSYQAIQKDHEYIRLSIEGFNDKNFDFQFICLDQSDIKNGYGWYATERNLNGKVVAKFTVRKVEEIKKYTYPKYYGEDICDDDDFYYLESQSLSERKYDGLQKTTCLSEEELYEYLDDKQGFAYHIEDLVIFDKPKELSEFKHTVKVHKCSTCCDYPCEEKCGFPAYVNFSTPLTKAPQNYCYVESEE